MIKKLILIGCLIMFVLPSTSAAWTQKWHYDTACHDYAFWYNYVQPGDGTRIWYTTSIMAVCADVIDNGVGSAGKPIQEVFITSGEVHGDGICPICGGGSDANVGKVPGCIVCLNGATGQEIWRYTSMRIFVQNKLELADVNLDGDLELLWGDYHGYGLLDAATGQYLWGAQKNIRWADKYNVIIRDPRPSSPTYGQVFIYKSLMNSGVKKINAQGVNISESISSTGPCFGGCSAGDMNNDGYPEIVEHTYGALTIGCYDLDLNTIWKDTTSGGGGSCPVLIDVNEDGWPDVVKTIGASEPYTGGFRVGVLDGRLSWENRVGVGTGTAIYMTGKGITQTELAGHNSFAVYKMPNGHYYAFTSTSNITVHPTGVWDLTDWVKVSSWDNKISQGQNPVLCNVYGDTALEVLSKFSYNKIFDLAGNQVGSCSGSGCNGHTPSLVADFDGDGLNEVLVWGSNTYNNVPGSPWPNGWVWSNGWFVCWDTDGVSLNTLNTPWGSGVFSQLYSAKRQATETSIEYPLWLAPTTTSSITVTSPNGGEQWIQGTSHAITWTSSGVTGNVKIELYSGGTLYSTLSSGTSNTGSFSHTWNEPLGTTYKVKITSVSDTTVTDSSNSNFAITQQTVTPTINLLYPDGGESLEIGSQITISWEHEDFNDNIKIELFKGSSLSVTINNVPNTDSFLWTIPETLVAGTDYSMKITSMVDTSITDTGGMFELVSPPGPNTVRCWKCISQNAEYTDFSEGTVCGSGAALDYPYNILPNCYEPPTPEPGFEMFTLLVGLCLLIFILKRRR